MMPILTDMDLLLSFFLGVGLAASAGFRVFLPLLVLGLSAHLGLLPLGEGWAWLATRPVLIALCVASVLEIIAYFLPWLDNVLDAAAIPLASAAGTLLVASSLTEVDPMWQWGMAIVAGGGTAGTIKGSSAGARLTSTAATGGLANPVVSSVETAASIALAGLAVLAAPVAFVLAMAVVAFLIWFYRRMFSEPTA